MSREKLLGAFDAHPEPVFAVEGSRIVYENLAARRLMVEDAVGRRAQELFDQGLLPPNPAPASGVLRHKKREYTVTASDFSGLRLLMLSALAPGTDLAMKALTMFTGTIRSDLGALFTSISVLAGRLPPESRETLLPLLARSDRSACLIARTADNFARVFCGLDREAHPVPLDLRVLVRDVTETVASLEIGKQTGLRFEGGDAPLPIVADGRLLEIMLMHLISNAVKYAGDGAEILVSVRKGRRNMAVTVADNGPGVRPELLGDVFAAYASPAQDLEPRAGSGLGLGVVRQIASLHGGSAVMESAYGHGASVTVSLPRNDPDPTRELHTGYKNDISIFLMQMADVLDSSVYENRPLM